MRILRCWMVATVVALSAPAAAQDSPANAVFLVARRDMQDPHFRGSVVLATHAPGGRPWGVIINRPLQVRLEDVFPDHPALKGRKDVLLFGGPVKREGLVFLVRDDDPPPGAARVLPNAFFTADTDLIDGLLRRAEPTRGLRVFAGYAGWSRGQLQQEIARGGWYLLPADAETVFDKDPERIWPELLQRAMTRHTLAPEREPAPVAASYPLAGP